AYAKGRIPTNSLSNQFEDAENIYALPKGYENLNTEKLFDTKYALHSQLYEYYDDGLDNWGIQKYSLSELFISAGLSKTRKFFEIERLTPNILHQLNLENNPEFLFQIPIIPFGQSYLS